MKNMTIAISDRAHINLKTITQATKKNQSDVLTELLERLEVTKFIKEMEKK